MILCLITGALVILSNLIAQLLQDRIDPRMQREGGKTAWTPPAQGFELVGPHPAETQALPPKKRRWFASEVPYLSFVILGLILLGCLFLRMLYPQRPLLPGSFAHQPAARWRVFFGTDPMGRDIFP